MELQFKKESMSWLHCPVREVRNLEQTQEIKLSEGMPDVGRVLAAWGQPILRGKEWNSDSFGFSGGMMVWVLYAPEDGSSARCIEGWIPCQLQWDLPTGTPEGQIRVSLHTRFVDARSVSPRKIMVRAGFMALGEALVPETGEMYFPQDMPEDVQLLQNTYPVRLCAEAGEKTFRLEEELTLPQSCPVPQKLIYGVLQPAVEEQRILGNRLVFRGNANLHVLYMGEEGQLYSWDFPVSLSQYADLKKSYDGDAQGEITLMATDLELSLGEEGRFRFRCAMAAQFTVEERFLILTVEDAYSPLRTVETEETRLILPAVLETGEWKLKAAQQLSRQADVIVDTVFLLDAPRQRRSGDLVDVELPGNFQILYYGAEGALCASAVRWEGKTQMKIHSECQLLTAFAGMPEPRAEITVDGMDLTAQLPVSWKVMTTQELPSVTGIQIGEAVEPDPGRPSLILCRAGEDTLWNLARENGSTVEAIRKASDLEGDPVPGQMLLIPVL